MHETITELKNELREALVGRDADGVARAVGSLACEVGATTFARRTGLARESLHRLMRDGGNLRMNTLFRALKELDITIYVADAHSRRRAPGGL